MYETGGTVSCTYRELSHDEVAVGFLHGVLLYSST